MVNSKDKSTAFTAYPTPADVTANNWWRSASGTGDNASEIKTAGGTTLIALDEGTLFAWSILAPQTSLFLGADETAQKYVWKTTTNGETIKGETPEKVGMYQDIDPSDWLTLNPAKEVPQLTFPDLNNPQLPATPKVIYGGEDVGLITIYIRAEDAAGNVAYDAIKYWIWPEGDRPIITAMNTPDSSKEPVMAERLLNGTIRLSGMAKDNERVKYVWFRILNENGVPYGTPPLKSLTIPVWKDTEDGTPTGTPIGGNWEEAGKGNQAARDG